MNPSLQSAIVAAVVTLAVWFLSNRANRRSQDANNALQAAKVTSDGKAVDLSVLVATVDSLKERVGDLESDLETEREARLVAIQRAEAAEARALVAEQRASRLEIRVTQLEDTLRANDITVPPVP